MSRKPDPERIDEENPECTEEMIRQARPAAEVVKFPGPSLLDRLHTR